MASQNILLSPGGNTPQPIVEHKEPEHKRTPVWRYHKDCPQGKVINYDDELDKANATGWVDHPGKVTRLPGLEKIYDDFHVPPPTPAGDCLFKKNDSYIFKENLKIPTVLTTEQLENAKKAEALKIASDLVEKKRLEEYEKAKNPLPPAEYQCLICPKKFLSLRALKMHGLGAHRKVKTAALTQDEVKTIQEVSVDL